LWAVLLSGPLSLNSLGRGEESRKGIGQAVRFKDKLKRRSPRRPKRGTIKPEGKKYELEAFHPSIRHMVMDAHKKWDWITDDPREIERLLMHLGHRIMGDGFQPKTLVTRRMITQNMPGAMNFNKKCDIVWWVLRRWEREGYGIFFPGEVHSTKRNTGWVGSVFIFFCEEFPKLAEDEIVYRNQNGLFVDDSVFRRLKAAISILSWRIIKNQARSAVSRDPLDYRPGSKSCFDPHIRALYVKLSTPVQRVYGMGSSEIDLTFAVNPANPDATLADHLLEVPEEEKRARRRAYRGLKSIFWEPYAQGFLETVLPILRPALITCTPALEAARQTTLAMRTIARMEADEVHDAPLEDRLSWGCA
jgi:hypothetical protein